MPVWSVNGHQTRAGHTLPCDKLVLVTSQAITDVFIATRSLQDRALNNLVQLALY